MRKNFYLIILMISFKLSSQCVTNISTGEKHTILLKSDKTVHTWGHGYNQWGQLGLGTNINVLTPTLVGNSNDWKSVFAGSLNTFVIKNNGTLWGTGCNSKGQLGIGTFSPTIGINGFIQVGNANNWKYISADREHTLGVKTDGTLWSWGSNYQGKLGDGTLTDRLSPTQIGSDNNWSKVAIGLHQSFGLKNNGTIWGWGLHSSGALGLAPLSSGVYNSPTQIGIGSDWSDISSSCSSIHTLALKNNGTLYVFGSSWASGSGALGLGDSINQVSYPTQIGNDSDWIYINSAFNTSFAIKTNGTLWGWGQNDYGQLGDGTTVDKNVPTQIGTDSDWVAVSAGRLHTIALKNNGALYSWGNNANGELGNNGINSNSNTPENIIPSCVLSNQSFINNDIILYPNPANDFIYVDINSLTNFDSIEVYDIVGRKISELNIYFNSLNISHLPKGIYNILFRKNNKIISKSKLIKE